MEFLTMDTAKLLFICASLIGGMALQTWGIIRYVIDRQSAGDRDLHRRLDSVQNKVVTRPEYDRDMARIHTDLGDLRNEIKQQGTATTSRLDTIIFALTPNGNQQK